MTSSDLFIVSLTDAKDNHDRLLTFLSCAARKYNESRQCSRKNGKRMPLKEFVRDQEIDISTQINASLFVNSLLYYVFSEAGIEKLMQDRNNWKYPSKVFTRLYKPTWQKEITSAKKVAFKNIHNVCCNILDMSDVGFATFIENVAVLNYLNMCTETSIPAYNADTKRYSQRVNNTIMSWAVDYTNALIKPESDMPAAYSIKLNQDKIIESLRTEALPTTPETPAEEKQPIQEVTTASVPEERTISVASDAPLTDADLAVEVDMHPAGPEELAETFRAMCLAMEHSWSPELKTHLENLLAPAKELVMQLSADISSMVKRRDRLAMELNAISTLMRCWEQKSNSTEPKN